MMFGRLTREFTENFLDFLVAFLTLKINLELHYSLLLNIIIKKKKSFINSINIFMIWRQNVLLERIEVDTNRTGENGYSGYETNFKQRRTAKNLKITFLNGREQKLIIFLKWDFRDRGREIRSTHLFCHGRGDQSSEAESQMKMVYRWMVTEWSKSIVKRKLKNTMA